ncbi:unnamed protein product [Nezara viridula]|uniref:Odorant receptor n=1 Tax=Nezara viridula TaxID=85310 RepID=A0A9P0MWI9_NEZVI|nr:unnamed protein product [Nezara viridula]
MAHQTVIEDSDIINGLQIRFLKLFGIWQIINDYRKTGKQNIILKIQVFITVIIAAPSVVCTYVGLLVIEVDIQKATILNFHSLPTLQALCRYIVFWYNIDSLSRLYNLMKKDFLEEIVNDMQQEKVEFIYRKVSRNSNKTCAIVFVAIAIAGAYLLFSPGISVEYIMHRTGNTFSTTGGRKKISTGWYPVPMDTSPCYEFILFYEGFLVT